MVQNIVEACAKVVDEAHHPAELVPNGDALRSCLKEANDGE